MKMCDRYLESYHKETVLQLLEDVDENKHFSINIDFVELFENDPNLGNSLLREHEKTVEDWDDALRKVQSDLIAKSERQFLFKNHVHCRIFGLPVCPELRRTIFPLNDDANKFLQVSGTVVRMTSMKMLEYKRQYICAKCKYTMLVTAEYDRKNIITPPKKCGNLEDCPGTNIISTKDLKPEFCKDYQEIKMQENVSKLAVGCIPNSMWVTLEDDLVDSCKPGDNITVCGVVKRRWGPFIIGKRIDIELVIKANHIQINNSSSATSITPELKGMFQGFWQTYSDRPLAARDIILKSICPQLFGLHLVKLAVAVVLAGGSHINGNSSTGVRVRAEPHLLLVGDPGTGKSQLLRFASKIIPRSVLTTGVGSTAAGLTVTAVMENGEWQLEAGALVLSDGGICCIDEFNSMKEHDRTSIHEAMEQQSISVAKASIVCKLSTRCSILAATNPKGNLDPSQPLSMNIALASPLLSRFDLILLLRDKVNNNWDSLIADYILNSEQNASKLTENIYWTVENLQAYFAVIKKINPILTEDSNKILSSYYQAQRRKNGQNKSRTTVRLLDSLVRLSQGHARLMYHKEVQIIDAVMAVTLVETAMEADSSLFDLHFDVQNDFPDNPMANYRELVTIVLNKLQLPDLLEKEVAFVDTKITNSMTNTSCGATMHKTESRFFHQDQPKKDETNKDENIEFDNRPVNIQKIKRSKGKSDINPKKIKLKDRENEVMDDLAALDYMPSINDHLSFLNVDEILNLDAEIDQKENETEPKTSEPNRETLSETENIVNQATESKIKEDNRIILSENKEPNEVTSDKTNSDNVNKEAPSEDVCSQRTRCRRFLSKFKFIPKETEPDVKTDTSNNRQDLEVSAMESMENINSKPHISSSNDQTDSQNLSQSSLVSVDVLKQLQSVPQSTQREKFKFRFKKTENPVMPQSPANIFESQEELENLDLDL